MNHFIEKVSKSMLPENGLSSFRLKPRKKYLSCVKMVLSGSCQKIKGFHVDFKFVSLNKTVSPFRFISTPPT